MKKSVSITIFFFLLFTVWQAGRMYESSKFSSKVRDILSTETDSNDFNLYNSGRKMKIDSVRRSDGEIMKIRDISPAHELSLYLDIRGCSPCKDLAFKYLNLITVKSTDSKPNVIINNIKNRDLLVMQKEYHDKFQFYNIEKCPFVSVYGEDIANPIFFSLDSEGSIDQCFLVNYDEEEALKAFCNSYYE